MAQSSCPSEPTATACPIGSCTRTWFASRARGHGQPGGYSCRRLLRPDVVVYDAADWRAADASRILSETSESRGEPSATSACRRTVRAFRRAGTEAELTGIRSAGTGAHRGPADRILDELIAIDARIIYIGMHPDDQKILYERIKQTEEAVSAGYALLSGWLGGYLL